jgi:serine protein kinase
MEPKEALDAVADRLKQKFDDELRIQSFSSWLGQFGEDPIRLSRSAAQYVADMIDYFGETGDEDPRRLALFDQEFCHGLGRVHGQEDAQLKIRRLVRAGAEAGRTEKMILLHGPNGSGKSVLAEAIFRGLEHYSHQPEGALHRFNWIFPRAADGAAALGFGGIERHEDKPTDSFALLDGEEVSARLICEMKDHPLFLLPPADRRVIIEQAYAAHDRRPPGHLSWILTGDLCQKCKAIFDALLTGYQGDYLKVLRHIQVERFNLSQRFRRGAVTILPMGSVDAQEMQITADISMQNLPPVLQNLKLFEPFGDLIDANVGAVEFGDFLKRPMDLNKYLLNAVEKGSISLQNTLVFLNVVMLGTSNEKHLDAFKSVPEFTSFKGRIELVTVPYLLEFNREAELYRDMLQTIAHDVHVAPHTFESAALWAVLTRLLPPDPDDYEGRLKDVVMGLTPMEKALLYDHGDVPERLERDDRRILRGARTMIADEYRDLIVYEGRFGASPREMRMVLTQAAYDGASSCLTPRLVFDRIRELIKDKTVYDFLKIEAQGGYHAAEEFVNEVAERYARRVLEEFQDAMALISEEEYDRRFDRYLHHVIAFNRGEKVTNPQTGAAESPSAQVMDSVESILELDEPVEAFRKNLVGRIGAFALDHPSEPVSFRALFPDLLNAVKRDFFAKRRERVLEIVEAILKMDRDDTAALGEEVVRQVETVRENLKARGYCDSCILDAAAFLHPQLKS